ncbi:MAG: tRNA (adenosine(37)-N6)-threonylcarbamoyltransferase complex ATPase subunit type 1 TsaE [Spirochaetia bacterium]
MVSRSQEETFGIGKQIGSEASPGTIISLVGPLGSGKTVLTKGIAQGLEIEEEVTSPSFTIMFEYEGRLPMYHIDLYRLSGKAELEYLAFEDYLYGDGVSVIEWGEKMDFLPPETVRITIEVNPDLSRKITFEGTAQ